MWWRKKTKEQIVSKPRVIWHVPEGTEQFLVPRRATKGSMAFDLICPSTTMVDGCGKDGVGRAIINTLVAVTLPEGYAMILGSRSGLAAKSNITVEAGWIDNDYRGLIKVVLYNHGAAPYEIQSGDRIAQAMLVRIADVESETQWKYPDPSETARGSGGLGSTGK